MAEVSKMNPVNKEPVVLSAFFVAIVLVICAFTAFTTEQDLAIQGLALVGAELFARQNVTPMP